MWRKTVVEPYMSKCRCKTRARRDMIENFFQNGELKATLASKMLRAKRCVFPSGIVNITLLKDVAYGVDEATVLKCEHINHQDQCQKAYQILMCI